MEFIWCRNIRRQVRWMIKIIGNNFIQTSIIDKMKFESEVQIPLKFERLSICSVVFSSGSETFSISMALSELVECISQDKREIHPVTVNIKGYLNVSTDLFISLPAVIGRQGVSQLIITNLNHSIDDNDFLKIVEILQRKANLTHVNIK